MLNRKVYGSLEEAFADLPEKTQKHCQRVAEYMRVIYAECCFSELTHNDPKAEARLRDDLTEMAYRVGLYHDIGKVYIPEELQSYSPDFGPEEKTIYRKHIDYNTKMIFDLYRKQFNCSAREETYAYEALKYKNEFWDGSGYPEGLQGKKIPVVSRILGCADTLDVQSSTRHSDTPFEEAVTYLEEHVGIKFDPLVVDIIKGLKEPLRKIYRSHLDETRTVPKITPVVPVSGAKTIQMLFRPVVDSETENTVGIDAQPMFHLGQSLVDYSGVAHLLADSKEKQNKQFRRDMVQYLTAEACDLLRQMDLAELPLEGIFLKLPLPLLKTQGAAQDILSVVQDEEIVPGRLGILIPGTFFDGGTSVLQKNVIALRDAGVRTLLTGIALTDEAPEVRVGEDARYAMTADEVLALGFSEFRLDGRDLADADCEEGIARYMKLKEAGLRFTADSLDAPEVQGTLRMLDVTRVTGSKHGGFTDAGTLLRRELSAQNNP